MLELDFGALLELDFALLLDPAELELDFALLLDSTVLELDFGASLELDFAELELDFGVSLELDSTELDELETEEEDCCSELELTTLELEDSGQDLSSRRTHLGQNSLSPIEPFGIESIGSPSRPSLSYQPAKV